MSCPSFFCFLFCLSLTSGDDQLLVKGTGSDVFASEPVLCLDFFLLFQVFVHFYFQIFGRV
jgi:hypothetical protein